VSGSDSSDAGTRGEAAASATPGDSGQASSRRSFHPSDCDNGAFDATTPGEELVLEAVQFQWLPAGLVDDALLGACAALYSGHYGVWGPGASAPAGQPVRLGADRLREWIEERDVHVALARRRGCLVGYAIIARARLKDFGIVSWVTQFVVHRDHRNRGIGKRMLFAGWAMSDHAAWGITTSNPYAVRALEKATRRRCDPHRIRRNRRRLERATANLVPYLEDARFEISDEGSRVDTRFFLDRSTHEEKLRNVTATDRPWILGELPPGWEWFACCFADQEQMALQPSEIARMLAASDDVAREAYGRMAVRSHPWAQHTEREVEFAFDRAVVRAGQRVLDIGCGIGRHAIALARCGVDVLGVDYSDVLIDAARSAARDAGLAQARFLLADCRDLALGASFDAVLCLYDVVGTYVDEDSNRRILEVVARHLDPGGRALVSVMNGTSTLRTCTQHFSLNEDPDALLRLPASDTMQATGNVFDPTRMLLERSTGVVYRKERFDAGRQLPVELVVRDRRFSAAEIASLCAQAGLRVLWTRPVRAGRWEEALAEDDPHAKEILVLCERPR
jgi:2-polyprenyl-3-methyl-5-hydroxy-6-metoxy-1,4-benzoquinol methylase/GNAT superfamily N-acetyltransferase